MAMHVPASVFDYAMVGVLLMNCMLVLAPGLGCFIVRVIKGPAHAADVYPFSDEAPQQAGDHM